MRIPTDECAHSVRDWGSTLSEYQFKISRASGGMWGVSEMNSQFRGAALALSAALISFSPAHAIPIFEQHFHADFRANGYLAQYWYPYGPYGPYAPYPYYNGPPPPAYYAPPAPAPQTQAAPEVSGAPPPQYWYYCDNPKGYYPNVQNCPTAWRQVAAPPAKKP
jgi:hypothetical protein